MKNLKIIIGLLVISYLFYYGFSEKKSVYETAIYSVIFFIITILTIRNYIAKNKSEK